VHRETLLALGSQFVEVAAAVFGVFGRFRVIGVLAGLDRFVVAAEDLASAPFNGLFSDIFIDPFSAPATPCRACRPQHCRLVASLSRHVCDIGAADILIEGIDAILQISGVLLVALRRLVTPEEARLFRAVRIVGKTHLPLDQAAQARITQ